MSTDLLLAPAANTLVTNLIAVASEQLHFAIGWKGDLRKFRRTMKMLRGVLLDAEERNLIGSRLDLKPWIEELRAVADEADDVLEEVAYENLRRRIADQNPKWKNVRYFFTRSNPLVFRRRMANRVKNLNLELADINDWATRLGLQYKLATTGFEPVATPQQTSPFLSSQFIGRKEYVSEIEDLLVDSASDQYELPVIAIVGMAGLGKTTLAQKVGESGKVREKFGERVIWVCVSTNFENRWILKEMLGSGANDASESSIEVALKEKLEGKDYLLILDDVWNEERQKWVALRSCLWGINKSKGSRVLVTTRSEEVARIMIRDDQHIVGLQEMRPDECWDIIKQRAFGDSPAPQELEGVGKEISQKCKGVPLVASLIGATLQNRRDLHEWQSILQNHVWSSLERENGVLNIIKFSYDRLPELALKQCFAFCSIFPKDTDMKRDVLIQLWMANGFLSPPEDCSVSMEDIGEKYFRYLLSYSLFQEESNIDFMGRVRVAYKMHDLIHDFAQSISSSETAIVDKASENKLPSSIRHLNIDCGGEMVPPILRDAAPKLRTLLFSEKDTPNGVQSHSKRLRILRVRAASDAKQLSKCFGNSKSLRFLDISGTKVEEFPNFIKKLYNLQTFRFMDCTSLRMPAEGLGNLINLSHIYFSDEDRMPANLGKLTNLQTLKEFYVSKTKGRRIEELGSLSKLRGKLTIYNLELVEGNSEAESARLHEKALDELRLNWSRREDRDTNGGVLEGLQPHSGLQKLAIEGFGGVSLPSWMLKSGFSSLKELSIEDCEELSDFFTSDGAFTFQSLKKLSIDYCRNVESFSFSGLTSLEELVIDNCGVVNITGDGLSSCTRLRILKLRNCPKLKSIPNLHGLSSLREVVIELCGELACLPSGWSSCTALEVLSIKFCNLVCVPEELKELHSLVKLVICFWIKLSSFPEEMLGCLSKLKRLEIGGFSNDELEEFPGLGSIINLSASLEELELYGWEKLAELPQQIQHLTALRKLSIRNFKGVEALPDWLANLPSLETLRISGCTKLKTLPSSPEVIKRLSKLNYVFTDWPELEEMIRQKKAVGQSKSIEERTWQLSRVEGFDDGED